MKCLFKSFSQFYLELFVFFLLICRNSLYTLYLRHLVCCTYITDLSFTYLCRLLISRIFNSLLLLSLFFLCIIVSHRRKNKLEFGSSLVSGSPSPTWIVLVGMNLDLIQFILHIFFSEARVCL